MHPLLNAPATGGSDAADRRDQLERVEGLITGQPVQAIDCPAAGQPRTADMRQVRLS